MKLYRDYVAGAFIVIQLFLLVSANAQESAKELIQQVTEAVGGVDHLRSLKDVEYDYVFRSKENGIEDVSVERYIFDGEKSFAYYKKREYYVLPSMDGTMVQHFDGTTTESRNNGEKITEQQAAYVGHFFRKTNYYWFTMMYKLQDPGVNLEMMEDRKVDGKTYKVVEMTFGENIGETSDRYVLYVNPETKLIDQFLFTVKGFGFEDPFLMKVKYETIKGLQLTTHREYAPANWNGEVIKEEWNQQISRNIKFNNGFEENNLTKL